MSIGRKLLSELVVKLVSESASVREEGAELISDRKNSLNIFERRLLTRVLSLVAAVEVEEWAREAAINAIAELHNQNVQPCDVASLLEIDSTILGPSELDYLNEIFDGNSMTSNEIANSHEK